MDCCAWLERELFNSLSPVTITLFFCLVKPFISESKKQNLILSYLSKKKELLIHKLWSNPQNDGKTKWLEWLDFGKYRTRNATGINMSIAVGSPLQDNVHQ